MFEQAAVTVPSMPRKKQKTEPTVEAVEAKILDVPTVRDLVPFDARCDADQLQMALQGVGQGKTVYHSALSLWN